MELQLGCKITRRSREEEDDDDYDTSDVSDEIWIARDKQDAAFLCRETPSMFILTAHLHDYKRNSIQINIQEGSREIFTSGEKPIQNKLVIIGQVMRENQEKILGLRKAFIIPNGVVLDQIKAEYNQEEAVLKICMPKYVEKICGIKIEEVNEEDFEDSSHKVFREFEVEVQLNENPKVEIRNGYGEGVREEDGKEETEDIVIQSLEESDTGVLGMEIGEEIIGGRKEKEIEEPNNKLEIEDREKERVEEDIINKEALEAWETAMKREKSENVFPIISPPEDRVEGIKLIEIEEPKHENEDKDIEVKGGVEELELETENGNNGSIKEEIGGEGFKARETKVKELPMEPKEPLEMEETDNVAEIIEGAKQIEVEDETCEEGSQATETCEDKDIEVKGGVEELELETENGNNGSIKEEIGGEGFKARETKVKELPMEPKEPLEMEETDNVAEIIEGAKQIEVEDETCEEGSQATETKERWEFPKTQKHVSEAQEKGEVFEAIENEERGKTHECGESDEHEEPQVPKKQDSQLAFQESTKTILDIKVKVLRSSQLESPLDPQFVNNKHEVIGYRESHEGREIQEEEADEQRDEVLVEISKEIDVLKDIQVEAREEDKANEQGDEIFVDISQERREIEFKESEEKKKLHAPLVIAGSAVVVSLVVFLVRQLKKGK